jgi:hypothetical protein
MEGARNATLFSRPVAPTSCSAHNAANGLLARWRITTVKKDKRDKRKLHPTGSIKRSLLSQIEHGLVELASGDIGDGIMSAHTSATITLRQEQGRETVIARQDIKSIGPWGLNDAGSLEKQISAATMQHAEGFEIGHQPSEKEIRKMSPFFPEMARAQGNTQ